MTGVRAQLKMETNKSGEGNVWRFGVGFHRVRVYWFPFHLRKRVPDPTCERTALTGMEDGGRGVSWGKRKWLAGGVGCIST